MNISELFSQSLLMGITYAGLASLFGLGIGVAINLIKLFGGIR